MLESHRSSAQSPTGGSTNVATGSEAADCQLATWEQRVDGRASQNQATAGAKGPRHTCHRWVSALPRAPSCKTDTSRKQGASASDLYWMRICSKAKSRPFIEQIALALTWLAAETLRPWSGHSGPRGSRAPACARARAPWHPASPRWWPPREGSKEHREAARKKNTPTQEDSAGQGHGRDSCSVVPSPCCRREPRASPAP